MSAMRTEPTNSTPSTPAHWSRPLLTGHRGACAYARENSLTSFAIAAAMGADVLECDARRTRDGVLVLAHDGVVGTGSAAIRIATSTFAAVRARVPDILTLPQFLARARAWGVRVNVDLKGVGAAAAVVAAIATAGWTAHTVVTTRAIHQLRVLRAIGPALRLGLSRGSAPAPGPAYLPETCALVTNRMLMPLALPAALRRIRADAAYLSHLVISPRVVEALHAAGLRCYAWTVDDPARADMLLRWGVDGITTNRPDVLRPLFAATEE